MGFEPTISAGERPKTYALDRAATGTGNINITGYYNVVWVLNIILFNCVCGFFFDAAVYCDDVT